MELTRRKKEILLYIKEYDKKEGHYPTLQEIADYLGLKARSTIHKHVQDLFEQKLLKKDSGGFISLIKTPKSRMGKKRIPLLGDIPASPPTEMYEQDDYIDVPSTFIGDSGDVFSLKISGNSMIEIGIADGDFVFIKKQEVARVGQVVAVAINNETTLKIYKRVKGRIEFHPANKSMNPIRVDQHDDIRIIGILDGCYHRFSA
jgi:repressor LexA